jgi:DNA-directed RNA polymerase specialized sigma24 family protein
MAVAVTIEQATAALSRLDPASRALLDLSVRHGMHDEAIADVVHVEPADVQQAVDELLDRLAEELSLDGREERAELLATLPDLPPDAWQA